MRNVLYFSSIFILILVVLYGHFHWTSKINRAVVASSNTEQPNPVEKIIVEPSQSILNYKKLTKNLKPEAKKLILSHIESEEPIEIAVVGSSAQTMGNSPWPLIVQKGLNKTYGNDVIHFNSYSFGDSYSIDAIWQDEMTKIIESEPDIVLLEPFIMNDNGQINYENTIESIQILERRFNEMNEEVIFMLQPPHPIYKPKLYASQVKAIKMFAEEKDTVYLNHWENWPDITDEQIKKYVLNDLSGPTDLGNERWAEYLLNYFTGK